MSNSNTIYYSDTLVTETCFKCGIAFAMPSDFKNECRKDHSKAFYCPNGHGQVYTGKTPVQKERERADNAEQREKWALAKAERLRMERDAEMRSKAAIKGHLTRVKKRIANGVCPCCNRSFSNVENHMASQHPDFVAEFKAKEEQTA